MSSEPKVLIAAMGSHEGVVSWWESHSDGDLSTLLASCDNPQTSKVFSALSARVESVSSALGGDGTTIDGGEGENAPPPGGHTTTHKSLAHPPIAQATLKCATTLCMAYLDKVEAVGGKGSSATRTPTASDRAVLSTLSALHSSLLVLPRDGSKEWVGVVAGVQRACERAWSTSLPGAVACTPLVVMMLLSELQDPAGVSPTALKRLYALRGAFGEVDFEAPDSASLLELTLRCFVNPGVLKNDMGRKLLAHVMGLSDAMALKAHAAMRSLFPLPTTKWAEWVGDVYIRAWTLAAATATASSSSSATASPFTLETRCLQDLVFRGIHASTPAVFASVRDVASRLVVCRNTGGRKDMDALLSRIYAPIMWRALDSPNSAIRRNAATLFRDVFPLGEGGGEGGGAGEGVGGGGGGEEEGGGGSSSASSSSSSSSSSSATATAPPLAPVALQVQYLTALADDSNSAIRELGVGFLAEALARHWASFPHLARTRLIERLALRCDDGASPGVRVAGLKGLTSVLVGAPASHTTLLSTGALVAAARHIHDRNDRCRGATLGLLATVEVYKGSFPEGVPGLLGEKWSQDLMARLVMEEGEGSPSSLRAAEATAKLLLPTLFPPGVTGKAAAKRIAQSLPLYTEGTLALCAWATKLPTLAPPTTLAAAADALLRTAKKLIATGAEELGEALAAAEAAGEASAVAVAAAAALVSSASTIKKEGGGGGQEVEEEEEEEDTSFDRKRRGRPGAKKKGGKATAAAAVAAAAAALGEEEPSSSSAPSLTTSTPSPTSESLELTLKFLRATTILLTGSGEASSSSTTSTQVTVTLGDIEEMLSVLTPLSASSNHPLVLSLTESLFALVPLLGGGGAEEGLTESLWERLSGLTPHPSTPTSLPPICPTLFTAIAARDGRKGMGGVLEAALRSIEGALPTLQQALATHSVTSAYALLTLARAAPVDGGGDDEPLPMHPVIAAAALSHILSSAILGTLGVTTPELAVGALFPHIQEEEVRYGFINRAMPALVQGMALLPLALEAQGGEGAAGGGQEEVHHLVGAFAEACGSAWCKLTADQVASWVVYQKGGDEGGGTVATAETNTGDVVGWVVGQLLPPLSTTTTSPAASAATSPSPCVVAGHTLFALITELCGELVGSGMGVAPTLHLFGTLTHPTLLSTSPHLTASPILAPALLKLAITLVSAASEGLLPGSPSILPNATHPPLLASLARLLAHTSSPTLPTTTQGLAFGAAGEIIDRMGKLELGGVWSKRDMSRVLSSLLTSLLFPRGGGGEGGYTPQGGRNIATAFALACAKWPWASTAMVGVMKGALENALGAPLTLAAVAFMGCEALGVCVQALKKQQQQGAEVLSALKATFEANAEVMQAFERLDGGAEILSSIMYSTQ